jgi:dTDP-4-amino-4,6-dideoxygalactose transaminase
VAIAAGAGGTVGFRAMSTVPFANFARATEAIRANVDAAVARVIDSGWYVLGREGDAFEAEFAAFTETDHAVGVASGTDAIELALRALGIGAGHEVVTQANTCVPTVAAIVRAGATPVLCDVEPEAGTMDPQSLAGAIGPRTRAVIPVHLYGQCGDIDAISEIADGLAIVEDCAQAHGARLRGRRAGSMGVLSAFSFYPTKNLGALGDGGAVAGGDDELAHRLRMLRQYGQTDRYRHVAEGVNSRLDELQAAILRAKLPRLEQWNERRRSIAAIYAQALEGTEVVPLARLGEREHVFHLFVARTPRREAFQAAMKQRGVATLVHYPQPIHGHAPYAQLAAGPVSLAVSEALSEEIVSLPIYPELTDTEVEHVAAAARDAAGA